MQFLTIFTLATAALAAPVTEVDVEARGTQCGVHGWYSVLAGYPYWYVAYTGTAGKRLDKHEIKDGSLTTTGDLPQAITATRKSSSGYGYKKGEPIIAFSYKGQNFDNTAGFCSTGAADGQGNIQFDCGFAC